MSLSLLPGLLFSLICSIVITYDTSLCAYYIFLLKSGIHFNVFTFHISNNNDNKAGMLTLKLSLLRSHIFKKNYAWKHSNYNGLFKRQESDFTFLIDLFSTFWLILGNRKERLAAGHVIASPCFPASSTDSWHVRANKEDAAGWWKGHNLSISMLQARHWYLKCHYAGTPRYLNFHKE